ncbi:MAG: histone deacetylase family protein [Gammaproteobacteria bacterium]
MHIIASDTHRLHNALELSQGKLDVSTESPSRATIIADALKASGYVLEAPDSLDLKLLNRVHDPDYVEFLSTAWDRWHKRYSDSSSAMAFTWPARGFSSIRPEDLVGQLGYYSFSADSSIVEGTWAAVTDAAAMAQTAADRVIRGASSSYALCRPPGHHAGKNQFGGYCFLNNSAVAAQRLRDSGHSRVAVLDIDYHHGNGTQNIFYSRSDVLTISIHADPAEEFPWFAGRASEAGEGEGLGWNLNLPLPRGTLLPEWKNTLGKAFKRIEEAQASAVVVALGVDTYVNDPLGTFTLDTDDYSRIAATIQQLGLPTVIVQEGGYAVDAIGRNVAAFLEPFNDSLNEQEQ